MATMLRDVIDIREDLSASDFVLTLSEGVTAPTATLDSYVVTDQLAACFEQALSRVKSALDKGKSEASFLHGSFGSGKSHFMSVLRAVLRHDPHARGLKGLAPVLDKHDSWLTGRKILCLNYHLIGAESVEDAILGGYLVQVRELDPDGALPELHNTERLFTDADNLRDRLGDEAFFAGLPNGGSVGWGKIAKPWDSESYDRARRAALGDTERGQLVTSLTGSYFTGYTRGAAYLPLDEGLEVISIHAKRLGFDCAVLFLDELVLWLASRGSDADFVGREASKVAKLVESASTHRALPLISFVARQRDLRDFLGDKIPGAEKFAIGETFRWWEDRFNQITLADGNLPVIVNRRLLEPRPGMEHAFDAAFAKVTREPKTWNILMEGLDESSDAASFRLTYPFSPALVSTMVAFATLLQRERTALRTMADLLRRGKDELTIDDIIPVGDVYDVLMDSGVVPLTKEMQRHFANARRLYDEKLLPRLLRKHGLANLEATKGLTRTSAFVTDARLVKTALLAALAPNVPALSALTAGKLAALNHGTIATPLKGMETERVLRLFKELMNSGVSEIHMVDDPKNPLISIQLSSVDYESVLERVSNRDTKEDRQNLLREMVFASLGVSGGQRDTLGSGYTHSFVWRGSRRIVDIVYGNIRNSDELPEASLLADGDRWKIVIDFPFDDQGYGPTEDLIRFENLERDGKISNSVAWIPAFFTQDRENDLGELVCLRWLFASNDRYELNASHLSNQDRAAAKALLLNRRATLESNLQQVIQQAYGAAKRQPADIDLSQGHSAIFKSLHPGLNLGAPVGATLSECLTHVLDQMFSAQYPDHPKFTGEITKGAVNTVLQYLDEAAAVESGRVPVPTKDRETLRRVANILKTGEMLDNAFLFDGDTFPWRNRFVQHAAKHQLYEKIPVSELVEWIDQPNPRGLEPAVRGLVIAAFALMQDREWFHNGSGPVPRPPLDRIDGYYELRLPRLPEEPVWRDAMNRAAKLFGVHAAPMRTAANVNRLAEQVRGEARPLLAPARELVTVLNAHRGMLGLSESSLRLSTATTVVQLVTELLKVDNGTAFVEALANAPAPVTDEVLGRSLKSAESVVSALEGMDWGLLDALAVMTHDEQATALLDRLREAAGRSEFQESLGPVLAEVRRQGQLVLARQAKTTPPAPSPVPNPGPAPLPPVTVGAGPNPAPAPAPGSRSVKVRSAQISEAVDALRAFAAQHPDAEIIVTWSTQK
ncbi:hypothetical protein ABZ897_28665 [Nonomuraea sp. NPDC046802]|uniref:hypothetical protein n=1 Tax=Nonomuraea sp. NPDC046802 TaxID=3154919 RepID=UPI0033CA4D8A